MENENIFFSIKGTFIGVTLLSKIYRFQVHISVIHVLCNALCAHHPEPDHLLSPYIWFPLSFTPLLSPLPSGIRHTVASVCEFQLYIPHRSEIIRFLALYDGLISLSVIFSRSILCCCKWQHFIFSYD